MSGGDVSSAVNVVGTVLSAAGAAKSLLTKGPKMPSLDAPATAKPVDMPTTDDDAVKRARRVAMSQRQSASGRDSTILQSDETLG